MTNAGVRLGLVFLTLLVASTAADAQSVGNDGSLSYGYTFPLPAARGRYQPVLGLSYNSSSQGDYSSGLGWALSLSYIDTSTRATLTTSGAPRTQLWLVMNGGAPQLLAPISSTTYRPDIDSSYHLVTAETLPGLALTTPPEGIGSYYVPCKFLMTDGVGNTFCFGSPTLPYPNSLHANPNRAFLLAVYDVDSNFTLYDYTTEDTINGTGVLLAGIRYSQFFASTGFMDYAYHATVAYLAQPNPVATEVAGEFVFHSQTLSSVTIKYGEALNFVTEYSLAYSTESTETSQPGRPLLQNIKAVNSVGASFDSGTSFSYAPLAPLMGRSYASPALLNITGGMASCSLEVDDGEGGTVAVSHMPWEWGDWVDLDGDGRLDFVWEDNCSDQPHGLYWLRNTGAPGAFGGATLDAAELVPGSSSTLLYPTYPLTPAHLPVRSGAVLIDFDGDGRPDWVYPSSDCSTFGLQFARNIPNPADANRPSFGPPSCIWTAVRTYDDTTNLPTEYYLKDLTGDGVVDLLANVSGTWTVFPGFKSSTTTDTFAFASGVPHSELFSMFSVSFADVNGDGWMDLPGYTNADNTFIPSSTSWGPATIALPMSPHPLPDMQTANGDYRNLGYALGTVETPGTANVYDLDGDGFPDGYVVNYIAGGATWWRMLPTTTAPDSALTSITSPTGAITHIVWANYSRSAGNAPEPSWVVSSIQMEGPGLQPLNSCEGVSGSCTNKGSIQNYFYANMQQPVPAWNDPLQLVPLGFADTYTQEPITKTVVYTQWGNNYLTAHMPTLQQSGVASTDWSGTTPSSTDVPTYFETVTHAIAGRSIPNFLSGTCLLSPVSSDYPVILVSEETTHTNELGTIVTNIGTTSGTVDCTAVDIAGNITELTIQAESVKTIENVYDTTAQCKSCPLETAVVDSLGVRSDRYYMYDTTTKPPAPTTNSPSLSTISSGHLAYVWEEVSPTHFVWFGGVLHSFPAIYETPSFTAYNADGTVATVERDYDPFYSDIAWVVESYTYDSTHMFLAQDKRSDGISTPLVVDIWRDAAGRVSKQDGPYLQGTTATTSSLYLYDDWGRLTWGGLFDGVSTYPIRAMNYTSWSSSTGVPASVTSTTFASKRAWPSSATPLSIAADDLNASTTYYDGMGRPFQTRTRLGTGTSGDSSAQITEALGASEYLVSGGVVFDGTGRVVERLDPYYSTSGTPANYWAHAELATTGLNATSYLYDDHGRATCAVYQASTSTDPGGLTSCPTSSDSTHRVTSATYGIFTDTGGTHYLKATQRPDYNSSTSSNPSTAYTMSGRLYWAADAGGNIINKPVYDQHERVVGTTRSTASGSTSLSVSYAYDMRGRKIQIQEYSLGGSDQALGERSFSYAPTGELIEMDVDFAAASTLYRTFRYGSLGRIADITDSTTPSGGSTTTHDQFFTYDSGASHQAGRIVGVQVFENGSVQTESDVYAYDAAGRVLSVNGALNASGSLSPLVQRSYRPDGRLLQWTATAAQMTYGGVNNATTNARHVVYSYDSAGRLVLAATPSTDATGSNTLWSAGCGSSCSTTGAYDALAHLTAVAEDNGGTNLAFGFDSIGNLASHSITMGSSYPFYSLHSATYTGSKLSSWTDSAAETGFTYNYDTDGRLTNSAATAGTLLPYPATREVYSEGDGFVMSGSDSLWNLQSVTGTGSVPATATYHYNYSSSGEQLASISGTVASTSSYAAGNLTSQAIGGNTWSYGYDAASRLNLIQKYSLFVRSLTVEENISYGTADHLAIRTFPAGSDRYVSGEASRSHFGDEVTFVTHITGGIDVYMHAPVGGQRIMDFWSTALPVRKFGPKDGMTYFQRDRLGSVIAVSKKGATAPAVQWRYLPYGGVDIANGTEAGDATSDRGYTGAVRLSNGLLWMRARVYDPQARRFVQADTVDELRYTYVNGDPISFNDPSGHLIDRYTMGMFWGWFQQGVQDADAREYGGAGAAWVGAGYADASGEAAPLMNAPFAVPMYSLQGSYERLSGVAGSNVPGEALPFTYGDQFLEGIRAVPVPPGAAQDMAAHGVSQQIIDSTFIQRGIPNGYGGLPPYTLGLTVQSASQRANTYLESSIYDQIESGNPLSAQMLAALLHEAWHRQVNDVLYGRGIESSDNLDSWREAYMTSFSFNVVIPSLIEEGYPDVPMRGVLPHMNSPGMHYDPNVPYGGEPSLCPAPGLCGP